MVCIGSGGAITGHRYILDELPYAQGLQFEQQFWRRHKIEVLSLGGAAGGAAMLL